MKKRMTYMYKNRTPNHLSKTFVLHIAEWSFDLFSVAICLRNMLWKAGFPKNQIYLAWECYYLRLSVEEKTVAS